MQFLLDIWWVLGDILEFACRVGIMICIIMFMVKLLLAKHTAQSKTHKAAALTDTTRKALPRKSNPPRLP